MLHPERELCHFCRFRLKETLEMEQYSDYNMMVIGYSLGAGICQLATMDLLAGEHKVPFLCVFYSRRIIPNPFLPLHF